MTAAVRIPLKIAKWLLVDLFAFTLLTVAAVLLVLRWPSILLNEKTLAWAARQADQRDIAHLSWDRALVEVNSKPWLAKRVRLAFEGLCVRMEPGQRACFSRFDVSSMMSLEGFVPKLVEIGPVEILGGNIHWVPGKSEKPSPEGKKSDGQLIPSWAENAAIKPIRVEIDEAVYASGDSRYEGSAKLRSELTPQNAAAVFADLDARSQSNQVRGRFELENPSGFWKLESWKMRGDASARLADGTRATADWGLDPRGDNRAGRPDFDYRLNATYRQARRSIQAQVRGRANPDGVKGDLSADARGLSEQLREARISDCEFGVLRQASGAQELAGHAGPATGRLRLRCPVDLQVPVPPENFPDIKVPTRVGFDVIADVASSQFPPSADSKLDGNVRVELRPILAPLFRGDGHVQTDLAGVPSRFPEDWKLDTELGLRLRVPEFQKLVAYMSRGPWAIWAPLHVLKGSIELRAEGRLDMNGGNVPLVLETRLASSKQKLDVDANGTLHFDRFMPSPQGSLKMGVMLSDIQLELPKLEYAAPPRFVPDPRFHPITDENARLQAGKAPPAFSYDVTIQTPQQKPMRFLSNLAEGPIPVAANLRLQDSEPASGRIAVQSFPVELFHRKAVLDHFYVDLAEPATNTVLNGKVRVPYADYTIEALVMGTSEKPVVKLQSDPPLPEDQLVAALLFGAPIESLDADQGSSVGQTQKALANGALGLASMYALASTPVQSVGYDPNNGDVIVKVKLAEGTSLNVGGGAEGSTVGIRRRLSRSWAITTDVRRDVDQGTQTITAFLEWIRRY